MKILMLLLGVLILIEGGAPALAASGKCTVVRVDGVQMVIECNKETRGFAKGSEIKIKSNNKNTVQNKN